VEISGLVRLIVWLLETNDFDYAEITGVITFVQYFCVLNAFRGGSAFASTHLCECQSFKKMLC
jgi:hypothetical protein